MYTFIIKYNSIHQAPLDLLEISCFSADAHIQPNQWIAYFTSTENRHALPVFTSLLNTVCAYDPVGYGVPYNHLMFSDHREPLVECALQVTRLIYGVFDTCVIFNFNLSTALHVVLLLLILKMT